MRKLILEMDEDMPGSDLFVFFLTWIQKMKADTDVFGGVVCWEQQNSIRVAAGIDEWSW